MICRLSLNNSKVFTLFRFRYYVNTKRRDGDDFSGCMKRLGEELHDSTLDAILSNVNFVDTIALSMNKAKSPSSIIAHIKGGNNKRRVFSSTHIIVLHFSIACT